MTETKSATTGNGLYAALAAFQAAIPHITKDATADAGTYKYKYADLADICKTAMPLLGKQGLAFTSRPTLNAAGQFVLAYKLTHSSGESEEGEYLLPSPEKVKPQTVGSAITYAKRYSFCAVTGITPAGEDDDGQQAQAVQQDDWRNSAPVQRGQPQQQAPDSSQWETPPAEPVTDMDWMSDLVDTRIAAATDRDALNKCWTETVAKQEKGECEPEHATQIKAVITERAKELGLPAKAKADAQANAPANGKEPAKAGAAA